MIRHYNSLTGCWVNILDDAELAELRKDDEEYVITDRGFDIMLGAPIAEIDFTPSVDYVTGDPILKTKKPALDRQAGGQHYKDMHIQPIEYCQKNHLDACESTIVKYVSRHREKGGAEDIKKLIHMAETLLELVYNEEVLK